MTYRRVITSVLIAASCLLPQRLLAQDSTGSYRFRDGGGGAMGAAGTGYNSVYASPYGSPYGNPYAGPNGNAMYSSPAGARPPGVQQATYGPAMPMARLGQRLLGRGEGPNDHIGPLDPAPGMGFATPRTAVPGQGYYGPDGLVTKRIPDEDSWDEEGPIERIISTAFQNTWFRMEYLLWSIDSPDDQRLGANLRNGVDLENFAVLDANLQNIGTARVPTTRGIGMDDNNGMRMTMGIPLLFGGDIEISGFVLEQAGDNTKAADLPSNPNALLPRFVATTTLTNGQLGNNVLLYDRSFDLAYSTHVWGADIKYVFDTAGPDLGFRIRPMVGFRYMNVSEKMTQKGVFDNFGTQAPLTSVIESTTNNHLYGSLLGARMEFNHQWFSIGAEPRVGLGVNNYNARVRTSNLRSFNDGKVTTEDDDLVFSPVVEAHVFGRIHVSENFSLQGGWQWIYAADVSRAAQNIYYNDNGINNPPGVVVKSKTDGFFIQGLTVGGELRFK